MREFSYHRGSAPTFAAVISLVAIEIVPIHLLVAMWLPALAWVLTGASASLGLWVAAQWITAHRRPIEIGPDRVVVRAGLRWRIDAALDSVVACQVTTDSDEALDATLIGTPSLTIQFEPPAMARSMVGRRRRVTAVAIDPDELQTFLTALAVEMGQPVSR